MKTLKTAAFAILAAAAALPAAAQDLPGFVTETLPAYILGETATWYGKLVGAEGPLDAKTRELVMLGVAAQIPCDYCVYGHSTVARAAGATDEEIKAAVAAAAAVRMWSTVLNGNAYALDDFKAELDAVVPMHLGQ